MSKEIQIRDGNLIASFDLENEDGDIDFCKLLKVSHGVAKEIGMFVDYIATNKIIKDQSNKITDLEAKLAEQDKKIKAKEKEANTYAKEIVFLDNKIKLLKQSQKQLAIEELEKLREYIVLNDEYDEEIGCNIIKTFDLIEDLDDKIKSLKGEE